MMMGMVLVACFAARLVTKFSLTRASTLGCTSLPTGLAPSPSSPRGRKTQPEYFCLQYNQTPMVLAGMSRFAFREYWGRRDPRQILFSVLSSSAAPRPDRFPPRQSQSAQEQFSCANFYRCSRCFVQKVFGPERQILDQKRGDTFKKL